MPDTPDHRPPPEDVLRSALAMTAHDAGPDCLDAGTLGAFYERSLGADERARAEAHVAGCAACQAVLAALVRSEPHPAAPAAAGWLEWLAPRLAWAAPVVVAGLAAGLWYATRPVALPQQEGTVASSAIAEEKAAAPAETERFRAEEPQADVTRGAKPPVVAAEPEAPPAAPPAEASGRGTPDRPAAEAQAIASEKREAKADEPRAVAPRRSPLTQVAAGLAAPPVQLAATPDGQVVWRFGTGGAVARSDDAGTTWRDQGPVEGEPLAASAVSAAVCWAVGRAGAVWRTLDGERWEKLPAPADTDLVAVAATGADQAVVTASDGRSWATSDGGRTWSDVR